MCVCVCVCVCVCAAISFYTEVIYCNIFQYNILTSRPLLLFAVISCGWLEVPYSTKADPVSYLAGSAVTITGCISGYTLEGPTQYTCQNSGGIGQWSPQVTTRCRGKYTVKKKMLLTTTTTTIIIIIIIIIQIT